MTVIGTFPPDEISQQAMHGVVGTRVTPGMVGALDGPVLAGPEAAGALTLLHTNFTTEDGAQRGYRNFAAIKSHFRELPGFLRWITFNDGAHGYALGFWRGVDDVLGFVRSAAHQAMVREQHDRPFEYSQFAGIWTAHTVGNRNLYCEHCRHPTPTPASACQQCGHPLHDPFT